MGNCIEADGLVKFYGKVRALDNVSFSIPCGDAVALLGPNGAGKTTTLRILAGLLKPDSGHARICGFDIQEEPRNAKACLGYLPEDAVPFLNLSVKENLEYVGILRSVDDLDSRIEEILEILELREFRDRTIASLSRGNRQKVALAMSIIHGPRVLLADEPLNYLDIPTQERVIRLLNEVNKGGTTILVSTHIMSIAERLTRYAIVIGGGRVTWSGSIDQLRSMVGPNERIEEVVARLMVRSSG
jgi:ABC-2 type transport system ATP-binding protein